MAPLPIIPGVYRVALNWVCGSATACNVLHFRTTGIFDNLVEDRDALRDRLVDSAVAHQWITVATAARVVSFDITPMDGTTATLHHVIEPQHQALWTGQPGGDYSQALGGVILLQTNKRGPRHRGRVFLPFLADSAATAGRIDATMQSQAKTAWETFISNMRDSNDPLEKDYQLVVASYKWAAAEDVSAINVSDVPGVQRRRNNRLKS